MLILIKSNKLQTPKSIEQEYPSCKYLFTDFTDVNDMIGHLYAVSEDKDSFREICALSDKLADEGIASIVMGDYNDGGMKIGVQREFRQ